MRDIVELAGRGVFEVLCAPLKDDGGALVGSVHMMRDISRSVHVEVQAEEHAHYLQQVLDAVPTPIYHKDSEGRYLVVNKAFAEGAGKERQDILGRTATDVFPAEVAESIREHDVRLLEAGGRTRAPRSAGTRTAASGRSSSTGRCTPTSPVRPAASWAWSSTSPTTVETREALRSREALLRGLFDTMPSGCAVYEVRGGGRSPDDYVLKDINRTALAWTDCGGRTSSAAVWATSGHRWPSGIRFRCCGACGAPATRSASTTSQYGGQRRGSTTTTCSASRRATWWRSTRRHGDAPRRRGAARAEAEMQAVFDLAGIPMAVLDTRGAFRRWNRSFQKALGYPPEDLRRMTIRDITVADERADMLRRISGALDGEGTPYRIERRLVTIDGQTPWFDMSVTPVLGPEGTVVALIAAGVDVTERRRSQDALIASQAQLREALGATVASMGAIVAIRDPYTAGHERRVAELVSPSRRSSACPRTWSAA